VFIIVGLYDLEQHSVVSSATSSAKYNWCGSHTERMPLYCVSPPVGWQRLYPPSTFIIIITHCYLQ